MRVVCRFLAVATVLLVLAAPVPAAAQAAEKQPPASSIAPLGRPVQQACTQMWCQEGYILRLQAQSWPQGYYSFKVIADDRVYSCEGNLPLPSCGTPAITCNDKAIQIGESGCALPADAQGFDSILLKDIPDQVAITISGPLGSVIHESKLDKKCSYPNDEACDPRQCCSALEAIGLNW